MSNNSAEQVEQERIVVMADEDLQKRAPDVYRTKTCRVEAGVLTITYEFINGGRRVVCYAPGSWRYVEYDES
jgi:hypothetical protein